MVYCSHCGEKIADGAYFCPKCGTRTLAGMQAGAEASSDEMRETLVRLGREMEKAFNIAAKNVAEAFDTARRNIQKSVGKEVIVCLDCGEKSSGNAVYCSKCGKQLQPKEAASATSETSEDVKEES